VQTKLIAYPVILAITVILTGCDAAETAANKVIETSKTQLAEAARDTFSESAKQISETIDKAQESVKPWMTDRDKKAESL
jgi:vacuolar-type H+-ATPase subunit H